MSLLFCSNHGEFTSAAQWIDSGAAGAPSASVYTSLLGAGQGKMILYGVNSDSYVKNLTGHATGWISAWHARTSVASTLTHLLARESGTNHFTVGWTSAGLMQLTIITTVQATGATVMAANTAYHWGCAYVIADAGGSVTVKLNGVTECTYSGDTRNGGSGVINQIAGGTSSVQQYIGDIVVCDNAGSQFNTDPGVVRLADSFAASNGSSGQAWTPLSSTNASNIDDPANIHDSDSTYNSSTVAGNTDWFTYSSSDFTGMSGTIKGVAVKYWARTPDGGTHTMRSKCKKGGTTVNGTTISITATYPLVGYMDGYSQDPSTSAAWASFAAITSAEYAYEQVA